MSQVGEFCLKSLVRMRRRLSPRRPSAENVTYESYASWQFESSARLLSLFPGLTLRDRTILEIGCGTGGRAAYMASAGAKRVVGIDINRDEIKTARRVSAERYPELGGRLEFLEANEDVPLNVGTFDLVIMIDAMEHVASPSRILKLAHGYTKPGGQFYFGTQGWYHHRGTHTHLLPFVNLLFSDETILNVIRWDVSRPDYTPSRFDSNPPVERWLGLYDLRDRPGEYLNKITVRQIKKLLRYGPFRETRLAILGFSRPTLVRSFVNPLRNVPILQEVFHSYLVGECVR